MTHKTNKRIYYTLKSINQGYMSERNFINGLEVTRATFQKVFHDVERFKQIDYTCYFENQGSDFVRQWELVEA